ncbi:hypothetical protein Tco_0574503, partial [Tanacetum coccineum]
MHAVVRKRLFAAVIVKRKATWQDCTKPKNSRTSAWFEEKVMLAEALESRVVLDEEQMAF